MRELISSGVTYVIEECLGSGQTASVFRALRVDSEGHSRLRVALKVIKDRSAVPWLRREFETLAKINSPNCVRVLSWENLSEGCALALEWIDGVSLLELVREETLTDPMIDELIAQVQEGLRALRAAGLHHGDLSPSNILLSRDGCVKIVDFATPAPSTNSRTVHGTPGFLAPEIWCGEKTSLATDLFALGQMEADLRGRGNFSRVPVDLNSCRERSVQMAKTDSVGLLAHEPALREMKVVATQFESRRELAQAVSGFLERKEQRKIQTASIPLRRKASGVFDSFSVSSLARFAAMVLGLGAVSVLLSLPVEARAPLLPFQAEKGASLKINSIHWLQVQLNGKPVGYAPFHVQGLRSGRHKLQWKSPRGAGVRYFHLRAGQSLHLIDKDLPQDTPRGSR